MKKLLFIPAFFLLAITASAQLNVTGLATLSVKPEKTVLNYTITASRSNYNEAVQTMTRRIDALTLSLTNIGFKKDEIKTSNFNIRQNKLYKQGEPRGEEYVASQTLEVSFAYTNTRLLEVLNQTASDQSAPSISILFTLSDSQEEKVKTQLIQMAVTDAQSKATLLAKEAGIAIKGIKEINYGSSQIRPQAFSGAMGRMQTFAENDLSNFEAKDMTISDQVFIAFEISQ